MKKTVLVTGGTGFIGTYLCKELLKKKYKINIIDLKNTNISLLKKKCKIFVTNINDIDHRHPAFKNVSIIYHLASIPTISRKSEKEFLNYNLDSTKKILHIAKKNKIKKIIYASSSTVYGIPKKFPLKENDLNKVIGPYGKSKLNSEKYLIKNKKNLIINILRPRVVIGPGRLGIFNILFKRILEGKNIYLIGSGNNIFQFTNVKDFVNAMIMSEKLNNSNVFNIGSSEKISNLNILKKLITKSKSKSKIVSLPAIIVKKILKILEIIRFSPLLKEQYEIADKNFFLDTSKIERKLNWKPIYTSSKTIIQSFIWYKKNYLVDKQIKNFGIFTKFKEFNQGSFQK